jgi:CHAT domain-containing protein
LRATRSLLSDLFVRGPSSNGSNIFDQEVSELTNRKDRLEAALARGASESSASDQTWDVTYRKIAGRLPDGSALIEFMEYDHRIRPDQSEPRYVAIAITRDRPPKAIALGSAAVIDTAVAVYRRHFSNPQSIELEAYKGISAELARLVWQPIASEINGVQTVFIAPDGALNIVSFAGLIDPLSERYIIEDHAIHYLASGRDLIKLSQSWNAGNGLLAFGDPDYDVLPGETPGLLDELSEKVKGFSLSGLTRNVRAECAELNGIVVPPLPGTRTEIERVKERWSDVSKEPAIVHFGAEASEEALKTESSGRRVIHLATHGYYIGERCLTVLGKDRVISENPLLLSGLFLAGANQNGSTADKLGTEDGIVTAEEVANLNLNGVQLVVLSACETGLGEVRNGEGVYGLRRSFQMAGARTVMSALWQVDDKSTADLMADLFVQDQQSIAESMRESALKQIQQRRANNQSDHPFYWAAFVANGDWKMKNR